MVLALVVEVGRSVQHLRFFFSSRRRHTRLQGDWSSDVCSSDLSERLGSILYRWLDWGTAEEVRAWVANIASTPEGALVILRGLVQRGTVQGMDDRVDRKSVV